MTSMTTNELARTMMPRTVAAADAVIMLDEVGSTNTYARELIAQEDGRWPFDSRGAVAVVAAERQTAGRGRLDHAWVSDAHEPAESFTVSFVTCVPHSVATDSAVNGWLQMIAGLSALDALHAALRDCGVEEETGAIGITAAVAGQGFDNGGLGGSSNSEGDDFNGSCMDANDADDSDVSDGDDDGDGIRESRHGEPVGRLRLKWPNDLFCDGLKLGGILAELVTLPPACDDVALIFGIGINIAVPADRLPTPQSTSLALCYGSDAGNQAAGGADTGGGNAHGIANADVDARVGADAHMDITDTVALRDAIAAHIVRSLRSRLDAFVNDPQGDAARLLAETRRVCWTLGHRVEIHYADGETMLGEAVGLNADASLTVRDDTGSTHVVHTADVGVLNR